MSLGCSTPNTLNIPLRHQSYENLYMQKEDKKQLPMCLQQIPNKISTFKFGFNSKPLECFFGQRKYNPLKTK